MLDSLGRKKAKENPRLFNARSLQRHINHEEFQGLTQRQFCKCISGTKGQCSFQGRARYWFPAFFFKSLGPCQQTNIYFSREKESHSAQLTRVWLLGRGCFMARASPAGPQCTDLLTGLYWWWPRTGRSLWRELTSFGCSLTSTVLTGTQFCQKAKNFAAFWGRNWFPAHLKI